MTVEIYNRQTKLRIATRELRKLVGEILVVVDCADATLHVTLLGDRAMRKLNLETFAKDETTNVISFPLGDMPGEAPGLLGDVIVSVDTARREAEAADMPVADRLTQLIIHGLLHILGYEHVEVDAARRRQMQRAEARVFRAVAAVASTILAAGAASASTKVPLAKRMAKRGTQFKQTGARAALRGGK